MELFITDSINETASKQLEQAIETSVDRFLSGDFGKVSELPQHKLKAIQKSFDNHKATAVGVYYAAGIAGRIMVIFDGRFSNKMKELHHWEKESLIIIRETECPYTSKDPLLEISNTIATHEQESKRRYN